MGYKQTWLVSNSLDHWFCSKTTAHFQLLPLDSSPDARCPELACSPCLGISGAALQVILPIRPSNFRLSNWFHWSSKNGFLWSNTNWLMIGLVYRIPDLLKKFEPPAGEFLGNHGAGGIRLQWFLRSSQTTNLKSLYNSSNSVVG